MYEARANANITSDTFCFDFDLLAFGLSLIRL